MSGKSKKDTGRKQRQESNIMEYEEAIKRLSQYLLTYHSINIDDVEITETRGYWRMKNPCLPTCQHPIHGCIGNSGRIQHTISFKPSLRTKGKITSPYIIWDTIKNHVEGT